MRFTDLPFLVAIVVVLAACAPSRPRVPMPAPEHRPSEQPPVAMPRPARPPTWEQFQLQAARRLVMANPANTYTGPAPSVLLAIPVLEIELDADGDVRHIKVLRYPGQALDTVEIARFGSTSCKALYECRACLEPFDFFKVL